MPFEEFESFVKKEAVLGERVEPRRAPDRSGLR